MVGYDIRESKGFTFLRLGQLSVVRVGHRLAEVQQNDFDRVRPGPVGQGLKAVRKHVAVGLVDAGEVYLRDELDNGGLVRVVLAAGYSQGVDSVFVVRVGRAEDGGVPVGHGDVVWVGEPVGARIRSQTLFALFQLLQ